MRVRVEGLTKRYTNINAVDNLSLDIKDGEFVSILGPSGCGKSTLLYMLTGIIEPTEGNIYFDHNRINDVLVEKRNIGLVFQNYSLYPHLTVRDNLMFPLKMNKVDKSLATEKVNEISKILRIEDLLNRKPKELSGGQQQRVAIGRAIIKSPSLLLMDEPFSNLDEALRIEMREEIKNIQARFKITTLFVTHDQEEALSISDRILLMDKGKLEQYSTARELYEYPNSVYTASFIGRPKINIVPMDNIHNMSIDLSEINKNQDFAFIGIRPEDVSIGYEGVKTTSKIIRRISREKFDEVQCESGSIKGIIKSILPLGKDTYITFKIDEQDLRAIVTGHCGFAVGEEVHINFNRIYVFKE